ncbi:MAG: N-acetylmuramoyl-L-alanine amidase [Cytophagaceae bacterium]|nr:N-acetylmuramoyl-L-alanine amidase [Cytophagaceae bacterium]
MKKIIFTILLLTYNFASAQITRRAEIILIKSSENQLVSENISIKKIRHNPFISLSIVLEAPNIRHEIDSVLIRKNDDSWTKLEPDHRVENNNIFISQIDLKNQNKKVSIRVFTQNKTLNILRKEWVVFAPLDTKYLLKKVKKKAQATTENIENEDCNCKKPSIISREEWCPAGNCPPNPSPSATEVKFLIVHHTDTPNDDTDWAARVRQIWSYHVNSNGWADIGYNFLIDQTGKIYDGRADDTQGAHFSGFNRETSGMSLLGNFENIKPPITVIESLEKLVAWKACQKNIDILGKSFHSSSGQTLNHLSGHRDSGIPTLCPGEQMYKLLPEIRLSISNKIQSCQVAKQADLVIENIATDPENLSAGQAFDLIVKIKNNGKLDADSVKSGLRINNKLIYTKKEPKLAYGQSFIFTYKNIKIDTSGIMNFCVELIPDSSETNFSDNNLCKTLNIFGQNGPEDLYLSNSQIVAGDIISPESKIEIKTQVNHQGKSGTGKTTLDIYLSKDCKYDDSDLLIASMQNVEYTESKFAVNQSFTIPMDMQIGQYQILAIVDKNKKTLETNEANNMVCMDLKIALPLGIEREPEIMAFPNPGTGTIKLSGLKNQIVEVFLYNQEGKILDKPIFNEKNEIHFPEKYKGEYYLKIIDSKQNVFSKKILIE